MLTVSPSLTIELPWPSGAQRKAQQLEGHRGLVSRDALPSWAEDLAMAIRASSEVIRGWPPPIAVSLLAISPTDWSPTDPAKLNEQVLAALQAGLKMEADAFRLGYRQMLTGGEPGIVVILDGPAQPRLVPTQQIAVA